MKIFKIYQNFWNDIQFNSRLRKKEKRKSSSIFSFSIFTNKLVQKSENQPPFPFYVLSFSVFCFICQKYKTRKIYFRFPFFVLSTRIDLGSLISPLCMDKWCVTQSADQDTSGVWIKYSSSDACADCFRQPNYNTWPMTGFPKSGWLSCCSTETSRNRKEYFTIIVKTWVELTSLRLLA